MNLTIPSGMRFVSATGADASVSGNQVELRLGSLFSGDERRVVVEMTADGTPSSVLASATWNRVGQSTASVAVPVLNILASNDAGEVERGRDGAVFASATSVTASKRQLEAASAYARGDVVTAQAITAQNEAALGAAVAMAPPAAAPKMRAQMKAYSDQKKDFTVNRPTSAAGKAAAKSAAAADLDNLSRSTF